jgi:hypothetical protein
MRKHRQEPAVRQTRRCFTDENDISAEEETEIQGSRLQSKNEDRRRQKGSCGEKSQGKSKINRLKKTQKAAMLIFAAFIF